MRSKHDPNRRRDTTPPPRPKPTHPPTTASKAYLDGVPALPANAPPGWPHVFNYSCLDTSISLTAQQSAGHIPDLIATILYKHTSCTLTGFLDLSNDFRFHIVKPSQQANFVIAREGRTVTCGIHKLGKWKEQHVYRVGPDAKQQWTPVLWTFRDTARDETEEGILYQGREFVLSCSQRRKWLFEEEGMVMSNF
ncbi:hypothetical protein N7G274_004521 [Stereocaulon virgatum]|uniref:Uncharacterized protein n=1 Tax=Stereocaulon virgatum TaxID=373712 RepID=A0ABR4AA53_9LECA